MQPTSDHYLIGEALKGRSKAFGLLVEKYQAYVFTVVLRMIKVREEAEEITQDTFIKAYQSLSNFRGDAKFSSWLYRIAYRKALDKIRSNKKYKTTALLEEVSENDGNSVENALYYLEIEERKEKIQESIMQLPEEEAAIITFYYFEELKVKEISEITQLSEDNIKIKLYRSRKKLFGLLQQYVLPELTNKNGKAI